MPNGNEITIPHPENEFYLNYQQQCNEATKYFIWLEKKQQKFRSLMDRYPLFNNRNKEIIKRLKKDLPVMDRKINPLREVGYNTFKTPSFNFDINNQLLALFATQRHSHYALVRIRMLEEDYEKCLSNFYKIVDENKYLYNKNVSFLSITIAIISIAITLLTVFSGIFIEYNFFFSVF